jgi:hypothetical protein
MAEGQVNDVVLGNGVVSFDGRVLELFGHSARTGNRIHVAQIVAIDERGGQVTVTVRGAIDYSIVSGDADEATRGELAALIVAVRAAAPNL